VIVITSEVFMNEQYPSLTIDEKKCTGCMACELACSFIKEKVYSRSLSRIHVIQIYDFGVSVPIACNNCIEAPCVESCPTEVIHREVKLGIVRVDEEMCSACGECVAACPYGAIEMAQEPPKSLMCDLCDGDPACVHDCIYGAIKYEGKPEYLYDPFKSGTALIGDKRRWEVAKTIASNYRRIAEI
jgi:Fe-S-cluster-containing hydrogenase component 2